MLFHHADHPFQTFSSSPITLPLGCNSQPGHHVHTGAEHALDGDFMRLDRNAAGRIRHYRHVPTFSCSLNGRHGHADLSPQSGDDQLLAAGPTHYIHYRRVLRSEEHTSELQSRENLVCRLLLEKKNKKNKSTT